MLSEKLDVVKLTFYTAPVSLACLAPFFWVYEVRLSVTSVLLEPVSGVGSDRFAVTETVSFISWLG